MPKKKKIAIYRVGYGNFSILINEVSRLLEAAGCKVLFFDGDEKDVWMRNFNHYQIYESFLDFCDKKSVDMALFMEELISASALLSELKVRHEFEPKIVFHSNLREPNRSLARANTFRELLEMKQVRKGFFYSLIGDYAVPPDNFIKVSPNRTKYQFIGEPNVTSQYKEQIEEVADRDNRLALRLPKDKKIGLFFGRNVPTKGLNLLIESLDLLQEDVHIFIVTHDLPGQTDNNVEQITKDKENVTLIHDLVPEEMVSKIFSASDFLILPYKEQYEYGGSGIIKIAVAAQMPVVVSNVYPFNKAVELFEIGEVFGTGDRSYLARAINFVANNKEKIKMKSKFGEFEKVFSLHFDMARKIMDCMEEE